MPNITWFISFWKLFLMCKNIRSLWQNVIFSPKTLFIEYFQRRLDQNTRHKMVCALRLVWSHSVQKLLSQGGFCPRFEYSVEILVCCACVLLKIWKYKAVSCDKHQEDHDYFIVLLFICVYMCLTLTGTMTIYITIDVLWFCYEITVFCRPLLLRFSSFSHL